MGYEIFDRSGREFVAIGAALSCIVQVFKGGQLYIPVAAVALLNANAVEILWDREAQRMGLRATASPDGFPLYQRSGNAKALNAHDFLRHIGWNGTPIQLRGTWNEVVGILEFDWPPAALRAASEGA